MRLSDVGKVLAIVSAYDNRRLSTEQTQAWKLLIDREVPDLTLDTATEVVADWFAEPRPYFTPGDFIHGCKRKLRRLRSQVVEDVRAAKARGLISEDWPHDVPLPGLVMNRLVEARHGAQLLALEGGRELVG